MANNNKENKIEKFTKEAIGKTLNQFNKEIGIADLVEVNKNQDRILNGILSQVNDESTEKTEKSNIITLDNSTDGVVELKEIQGDTNVNVSKIEEDMPITNDIGEKEGNIFNLNEVTQGVINIGEIEGNTLVNCNKDDKKELVLMKDLSTQGDNKIDITEGVDGGLVDVSLEGNTLVNVSKTKDSTTITKAYTVENSGNHIALQGDIDGSCRPVITGNTLVNLAYEPTVVSVAEHIDNKYVFNNFSTMGQSVLQWKDKSLFKSGATYTIIITIENTCSEAIPFNSGYDISGDRWFTIDTVNANSVKTIKFTKTYTATDPSLNALNFTTPKGGVSFAIHDDILILEGDYTDKPIPDYFTGLQSSFEDNLVTQEMVDNGEEVADNLGKYRIDYKSTREDGTVGSTKTLYLNSPLLEGDTIEEKDGSIYHVHRWKEVVVDGRYNWSQHNQIGNTNIYQRYVNTKDFYDMKRSSNYTNTMKSGKIKIVEHYQVEEAEVFAGYPESSAYPNENWLYMLTTKSNDELKTYFTENPVTVVYELASPTYELIEQSNLAIPSYTNGHLDFNTAVLVKKVEFKPFSEELTYLCPNTQYTLQFISDVETTVNISLGGTSLLSQSIIQRLNRISITTPSELVNSKLIIDGLGVKISEVVVTDTNREFKYFEGMTSVGENGLKIYSGKTQRFGKGGRI